MSLPPLHSDASSTKENRDRDEATNDNTKADSVQQIYYRTPQHIAISKSETILLSSSGDVLVSRCRTSPYPQTTRNPYQWQNDVAMMCCDVQCDDISRQIQETSFMCSPWSTVEKPEGLLGGAPTAQVAPSPEAVQQHNHNGHYKGEKYQQTNGPRLRGGASAGKSPSDATRDAKSASSDDGSKQSFHNRAQKAFRTVPLVDTGFDQDEESIVPIRSFDYSHFNEGGNDMLPPYNTVSELFSERKEHKVTSPRTSPISVFQERPPLHGIPTFVPAFAQIKVTKLSAHPLGSHVLLISNAGLLYSYGLNTYGQLGIGLSTHTHGPHRGYFAAPTIVTPLVENGGKAIACAAGVTHSLVVIVTEEQRLVKSRSMTQLPLSKNQEQQQQQRQHHQQQQVSFGNSNTNNNAMESIVHHQLYGFGRNDYMKLGLVTPKLSTSSANGKKDEMEDVLLPRRVALRAKVRPNASQWPVDCNNNDENTTPPPGIFAVEASAEHSAALVRRASGDIELYTWGNAMYGALGVVPHSSCTSSNSGNAPTSVLSNGSTNKKNDLVPATTTIGVVPVPSFVANLSRASNPRARSSSILLRGEYPTSISLGYRCSLVTTSQGRCFSFGVDEHGMLGLGKCIRECSTPSEIPLPPDARHEKIVSVRTGAASVLATTRSGSVLAWGTKKHVGLASGGSGNAVAEEHHEPTTITGSWEERSSHKGEDHIQWSPKRIVLMDCRESKNGSNPKIVEAVAGYDNAVLIAESGRVLSCGTASGRLGLGEVQEDVTVPQPMFGGLKLWHQPKAKTRSTRYPSIPRPRNKLLHRGKTVA